MGRYSRRRIVRKIEANQNAGVRQFVGTKYPRIPLTNEDTYVYANEGDRFDTLALEYYGNSDLWWVISIANEDLRQDSYYLPLNQQIRIPANVGAIEGRYNAINGVI